MDCPAWRSSAALGSSCRQQEVDCGGSVVWRLGGLDLVSWLAGFMVHGTRLLSKEADRWSRSSIRVIVGKAFRRRDDLLAVSGQPLISLRCGP